MVENNVPANDPSERDGSSRTNKVVILAVLTIFLLVGVGAIVAGVALFGSGNSSVKTEDADQATSAPSTTTSADLDPGSTTGGDTDSGASTTPSQPSTNALEGASTTPVSVPFPAQDTSLLTAVRVGAQDGFDRVTFEFDGPVPGYMVQYVPGPLTEDPSDKPISIGGDKILLVTMSPASGVSLSGETYKEVYTGPRSIDGPGRSIAQVVRSGDFEAVLTWAIGVNGEKPFKVSTLTSPSRLVVDVAN